MASTQTTTTNGRWSHRGPARRGKVPVSHTPKWSQLAWGVLRIDHAGDATVSDSAYLWLNPNPLVEPLIANADVTILSGDTNARDLSDLDFIRPFVGNNQTGTNARPFAVIVVDEIRLGTTYADMTFVPEPASCLLLVLGGLALCVRRGRR